MVEYVNEFKQKYTGPSLVKVLLFVRILLIIKMFLSKLFVEKKCTRVQKLLHYVSILGYTCIWWIMDSDGGSCCWWRLIMTA